MTLAGKDEMDARWYEVVRGVVPEDNHLLRQEVPRADDEGRQRLRIRGHLRRHGLDLHLDRGQERGRVHERGHQDEDEGEGALEGDRVRPYRRRREGETTSRL
jgi:hypothetical protein